MGKNNESTDEYSSEDTKSYTEKDEVASEVDAEIVRIPEKDDGNKRPSGMTKFVQFFLMSIGIVISIMTFTLIFTILSYQYGLINGTLFNRGSYIFETLTYMQYLKYLQIPIGLDAVSGIVITFLSVWSIVKKRQSRTKGVLWTCFYLLITLSVLGFFFYNYNTEEEKVYFLEYFHQNITLLKVGDQYLKNITNFMDQKKCCGPNGTLDFFPKININDSYFMPLFCHNVTSDEYKAGCYKKLTVATKKTIDDALNYIVLGSIAILSLCFVLYGTFLKTTSTSPKKVRDKLKKAFKSSKSYVGRKISKKSKQ